MHSDRHQEQNDRLSALLKAAQQVGAFDSHGRLTPACSALVEGLWTATLPQLLGMLNDGRILSAGPLGAVVYLDTEDLDYLSKNPDTRYDLASEMMTLALRSFLKRVVDEQTWDSSQSSLTTYFVNRCTLTKDRVLGRWAIERQKRQHSRTLQSADFTMEQAGHIFDQEPDFLRHCLFRVVAESPMDVRPILEIVANGFDIRDAARELEISENAVRNRLYRWRKKSIAKRVGLIGPEAFPSGYALIDYLLEDRRRAA
ncbi:hypothetical protein ACIBM3_30960 [Rhodococcus erythropolis]|uniref:hypothetical protein n=1 Tax=Rhodococcus erythropolis TaxID=1833 RepID=UPI0037BB4A08